MAQERQTAETIDVVLPAGGRISGAFAQEAETDIKALIRLNGETVLARTIRVLRETGRIRSIAVVGPPEALSEALECGADGVVEEGTTGPDNILRGLNALKHQSHTGWTGMKRLADRVLIMTTDLPFVTSDAVTTFLDTCPLNADIAVPVVRAQDFDAAFPNSHVVYVNLADGRFTLGCAFLVNPETVLRSETHLRQIFDARKSQLQTARLIGLRTAFRFLTKRLTVPEIVARVCAILRCQGMAVMPAPAVLAYDLDLPEELAYARAHVRTNAERALLPTVASASVQEGLQ